MENKTLFVVVDDDPLNNALCQITIKNTLKGVEVKTFTLPEKVLQFLSEFNKEKKAAVVVLLDINMPTMSAWEFLEHFEKFSEKAKEKIKIYVLSSSFSPEDINRALGNKHVEDYIVKPLTNEIVNAIDSSKRIMRK